MPSRDWHTHARCSPPGAHRRVSRRRILLLMPALLMLVALQRAPATPAALAASQQPPLTGVLVTSSATADDLEAMPEGGIVVRLTLENRTGGPVSGATVSASIPARAAVADSWHGEPGQDAGVIGDGAINWSNVSVGDGQRASTFAFRHVPTAGANGALIFRFATIHPRAS